MAGSEDLTPPGVGGASNEAGAIRGGSRRPTAAADQKMARMTCPAAALTGEHPTRTHPAGARTLAAPPSPVPLPAPNERAQEPRGLPDPRHTSMTSGPWPPAPRDDVTPRPPPCVTLPEQRGCETSAVAGSSGGVRGVIARRSVFSDAGLWRSAAGAGRWLPARPSCRRLGKRGGPACSTRRQ